MAFGVFIHRSDSIYDDSPAERYQFPAQYLSRAQPTEGDWIIYYEPRKVPGTRGYFAVAKVERITPGGRAEVEAAHIRPVEANGPDIVSNGLALSGTAHWMFDRGLISLGDDLQILVSRQANDPESICGIINKSGYALEPARLVERPHPHFLEWHREHCFKR